MIDQQLNQRDAPQMARDVTEPRGPSHARIAMRIMQAG